MTDNSRLFDALGFHYKHPAIATAAQPDAKRTVFRVKKALADIVHDTVRLEGNPFTFPEVKTLIEGITVGGHKVEDADQVLNQAASWRLLLSQVERREFSPGVSAAPLNALVARNEGLTWGEFRDGDVSIGGTEYTPPPYAELPMIFGRGINALSGIPNIHERAMCAFLMMALDQFFWDGNKRTGRLMMNGILLSAGFDAILVPARKQVTFNDRMIDFYNTKNATAMMDFLIGCSLDKTLTHSPSALAR